MTDTMIDVRFNVLTNMGSLNAQIDTLNAKMAAHLKLIQGITAQQAALNAASSKWTSIMKGSGQYDVGLVNVGKQVDEFGKRLAKNQLSLGEYRRAIREYRRGVSGEVRQLAEYQQRMLNSTTFNRGNGEMLVATPTGVNKAANATKLFNQEQAIMNTLVKKSNESLINWGKNTQWAGRQLTVGLTLPVVIFGATAAKVFLDADKRLTNLAKVYGSGVSGTTTEGIKEIKSQVLSLTKELSETTGTSLNDLLDLSADIAATGKEGGDLLKTVSETNRLMVLGDIERQEAMKTTLSLQTAFKQSNEELAQSIDFLNAAENATSLSMSDMTEAIPRAGTVVESLGGDVQDLALYMVAMREGGISAAEGANALKAGLASIINPSTKAKKILSSYGIDIESIVQTNKGQLTPTILALQKELSGLDGLAKSQSIAALFGKYQFARMSALFENIGAEGSQTLEIMKLMGMSASQLGVIAEKELAQKTNSLSNRWQRAINAIKNDMIEIGEDFVRIALPIMDFIDKLLKGFNALPGVVKTIIEVVVALGAILGPVVMTLGIMANFVGQIKKGWNILGGMGARAMGRPRPEFTEPLDQQTIAHMASLKKDTQAVFDHAASIEVATQAMRQTVAALNLSGEPRRSGTSPVSAPVGYGPDNPSYFVGQPMATTTSKRVGPEAIQRQMAMQLMADSIAGRPFGGAVGLNPTANDAGEAVGLVPSSMLGTSQGAVNKAAAAIRDIDAELSRALLETYSHLEFASQRVNRAGDPSDNFAAYSHLIHSGDENYPENVRRTGQSPFMSFMEWQRPNKARQGNVTPGTLPPDFIAGMQSAMQRVFVGGGAALWDQAMADPKLMNALKFQIAATTAKTKEEFIQMIQRMAGQSEAALAATQAGVMNIGDEWQAEARRSVTASGMDPDTFRFDVPAGSATPPPSKPNQPLPTPESSRQRSIPEAAAKFTAGAEAASYQMTTMKTAAGDSVRVFRLLDENGLELAMAMENAKGELQELTVNNMNAAGLNPGEGGAARSKAKRNKVNPVMVDVVDEAAVAGNAAARERYAADYAEWEKAERKKERAARNNAPASNWGGAFEKSVDEGVQARARAAEDMADATSETATSTGKISGNVANAAGAFGLLLSMSTLFAGNMDSALGKIAMYGGTALSMLPMLEMMTNFNGQGGIMQKFSQNFMSQIGGLGDGATSRLGQRITAGAGRMATAGKALAGAMFGPWGLAIGIAAAGIGLLIANNKKKWDNYVKDAKQNAEDLKRTLTNLVTDNADIFKTDKGQALKAPADAWKGYTVSTTGAAAASKTMVDQVKTNNAEMIEGLKKLDDDDLARRLKEIYSGLIIQGVSPEQADQFLSALGQALDKTTLTVKVVAELSGWAKGKDKEEIFNAAKSTAGSGAPQADVSNQKAQITRYDDQGAAYSDGGVSLFLSRERDKATEDFGAWGAELGKILSDGIQSGLITPENGKLTDNLKEMYEKIRNTILAQTGSENVLGAMLTNPIDAPKVKAVFDSVGVPIEQGVKGLTDKFMSLDQVGRDRLLETLNAMGPSGRSLANVLTTVSGSTDSMTASTVALNPDLAKVVGLAQSAGGGLTMYAGALGAAAASSDSFATSVANMTTDIEKATEDFSSEFTDAVTEKLDNYVENTREANAEMVENTREAEQDKMKAIKDGFAKKEDAAQKNIDRIKKNADKEIDAIKRTEDKRKAAFEAEQERIRRLTALKNYNVDFNEAVAGGDLFAAARIRNERDAFVKNNALEDKNAKAGNAADNKIAGIEKERDAKVAAAENALEKMKKADEASIESAQKASDARIEAAETAATASNKAAEKWVENQKKIVTAMKAEFAAAKGNIAETWRVAEKYAPKFGIPAATANRMWTKAWDGLGKRTAAKVNKEGDDPALAEAARQFTIKTIAGALGIKVSKRGQALMAGANPKMTVAEYFASRAEGRSDTQLAIGAGLAGFAHGGRVVGAGGPRDDKIPAWLSNGEFVHTADAVNHYGPDFMEAVNKKQVPKFAKGGMVGQDFGGILGSTMARMLLPTIGQMASNIGQSQIAQIQSTSTAGTPAGSYTPGEYGPQNSGGPAANTSAAANFVRDTWGLTVGTWRPPGGIPGDHPLGKALDAMTSNQKIGDAVSSWFLTNPKDFGTKYVIWQQRINSGTGWRGMSDRGSPTQNHMDHVHVSLFSKGGLVGGMNIPQLATGAKINYDNTLANLHRGEAVLTAPITSKFESLANRLSEGNVLAGEKIEVNFYGPVNSDVDVEAGVTAALRKRDVKLGRERVIK